MLFHAYEACDDDSFFLGVNLDQAEFERQLSETLKIKGVKNVLFGIVEANSAKEALDKIRAGQWNYEPYTRNTVNVEHNGNNVNIDLEIQGRKVSIMLQEQLDGEFTLDIEGARVAVSEIDNVGNHSSLPIENNENVSTGHIFVSLTPANQG